MRDAQSINSSTVVVVSPHFDDAVLSCWSVLDRSGSSACVLTVFGGAPPPPRLYDWDARPPGAIDSASRARERVEENRLALATTGSDHIDLPGLEEQYADIGGGLLTASDLRPFLLNAGAVYAPAAVGRDRVHPDHLCVRSAVLDIRPDAVLYSDQPYCRFPRDFDLAPSVAGRTRVVVTLTPDGARRKAAAIACYAGEVPRLDGLQARLERAVEEFLYEVFWRSSKSPAVD